MKLKVGDIIIYKGTKHPPPTITPLAPPGTVLKITHQNHEDYDDQVRWDVVALFGEITHDTPILHTDYDDFDML